MGQTGFQGVKQDDVTLTLFKVYVNPFTGPMVVKGRSKRKIKTITNFFRHIIGLKPVIQRDFSPFLLIWPVLFHPSNSSHGIQN